MRAPTPAQRFSQSPRVAHIQPHSSVPPNHVGRASPRPPSLPTATRASPRPPSVQPQTQVHHTIQQQQLPMQQQQPPQPQHPSATRPTATPVSTFQPSVPPANFLQHPPAARNGQSKPGGQAAAAQAQAQAQQAQYYQMLSQRFSSQGQAGQVHMQPQAQQAGLQHLPPGVRSSPMVANARLATRSPMPSSLTPNQNTNGIATNGAPANPANVSATNSPRPRQTIPAGAEGTTGSPRIVPQGHLVPPAGYQNLQFRPMQAQAQTQNPSAPHANPTGDGQQRPVQPAQTPKMSPQQAVPQQPPQQQRRGTPSQPPNVQQQVHPQAHPQSQSQQPQPHPQSQPQQHGATYPMYYGIPAQAGYSTTPQMQQQYLAAMSQGGIIPMQPGMPLAPMAPQQAQQQMRAMQQLLQLQQRQQQAQAQAQHPQHKAQGH